MHNNMLNVALFTLIIVMLGLNSGTPLVKAIPQVVYVNDDNIAGPWDGTPEYPYQNITTALANVSSGGTIFVYNGTYHENLIITKSVSLQGQNEYGTVIDGNYQGNVIKITASNVMISGFTIQRGGIAFNLCGIYVDSSTKNKITGNIIKDNYYGIYLYSSTNGNFSNNNILSNTIGIRISGSSNISIVGNNVSSNADIGIYLSNSENVASLGNVISNNGFGACVVASDKNFFEDNNISPNNRYGAYLFSADMNIFSKNNISLNEDFGIWLSQSTNNTLTDNNITFNERIGIYMANSTANLITGNNVSANNQYGMRSDYSHSNIIQGNIFQENLIRGTLIFYSNNNTFLHNNFIDDNKALSSINSTNHLDNSIEGNYWSDYYGMDEDQDGIGDVPYVIDENTIDNKPLMGKFSDHSIGYREKTIQVPIISNSTISQVIFNETIRILSFRVEDTNGTKGFCRISIPEQLVNSPHAVLIDDKEIDAKSLPISSATYTYLYFTYNHSFREVKILSKPYYELLQRYNALFENFHNLETAFHKLLIEHNLLNQTLQQALANFTQLLANYNSLNQTYQEALNNYYTLVDQYNSLNSIYNRIEREYANIRMTLWAVSIATIVMVTIISSVATRYHGKFKEQRKMAEKYKNELDRISVLHDASTRFKADVHRRRKQIEKFESKYGITVRPRKTIDDIITSLIHEKKKEKQD